MTDGPSRYLAEFVAAFREGQRARCERLDRQALALVRGGRLVSGPPRRRPGADDRAFIARNALQRRYLVIYRTRSPTLGTSIRRSTPRRARLGSVFSFGRDPTRRKLRARAWRAR